jgi:putative sigma-54 modulation protein
VCPKRIHGLFYIFETNEQKTLEIDDFLGYNINRKRILFPISHRRVDSMTITVTGRKVTVKETFKQMIEKELGRVARFFEDDAEAKVTVSVEKDRQTVEITIRNNHMVYRAEQTCPRMEDALDKAVDDLIRKIRKNKTRVEKRLRGGSFDAPPLWDELEPEEETKLDIVKTKKVPVKPISPEEAVLQMELLGHAFFMFRNDETNEINVVYRRKNGDYGLIEPD